MIDWATVASLATAAGTMVLGVATFASVRSANRAARAAERSLLAGLRPVLFPSLPDTASQKVMWQDRHFAHVEGGQAVAELIDDVIYLAISVRNVGSGMAVLDRWRPARIDQRAEEAASDPSAYRRLTIDLYIPSHGVGFWQGAVRDLDDPDHAPLAAAITARTQFTIDLLYGDMEGGQRTVTRFAMTPMSSGGWLASGARHWHLDQAAPR